MFPVFRDRLSRQRLRPFQHAFAAATTRSSRPCPACRNPMLLADAKGVEIDVCRGCQIVWFDRGEEPEPDTLPPRREPRPQVAPTWDFDEEDALKLWRLLGRRLPVELDLTPWTSNVPFATSALTLAVIVVGLFTWSHPGWIERYGFLATLPFRDAGITLFTYFFLHVSAWQLAGNAYFLVVFGDNVEEAAGPAGLLVLSLLGAAAGALAHALSGPAPFLPLVGAGAGVSALLAYYALRFPKARIGWYWMNLPAWGFALVWAGYQAALELWHFLESATQVSVAAHFGGAGVGVAFWALQRRMSPWTSKEEPRS